MKVQRKAGPTAIAAIAIACLLAGCNGDSKGSATDASSGNASVSTSPAAPAPTTVATEPTINPTPANTPSTPTPTTVTTPAQSPNCGGQKLTVQALSTQVEYEKGVTFYGNACLHGEEQVLAFDYDGSDGRYYLDDRDGNITIVGNSGPWKWTNAPIGNQGVKNELQTVTFVVANSSCTRWVASKKPNKDGDVVFDRVDQHGCQIVARVHVYVSDN